MTAAQSPKLPDDSEDAANSDDPGSSERSVDARVHVDDAGRVIDARVSKGRERVLYVGHDRQRYARLERDLADRYELEHAIGPSIAIGLLQNQGARSAIIVDIEGPPSQSRNLMARVREVSPETVRIWVADGEDLVAVLDSANELDIFRCITRPYSSEQLRKAMSSATRQSQLRQDQNAILRDTLGGSAKVLVDVLAFVSPSVFLRMSRVCHYVRELATILALPEAWQVEVAAMLSRIGCVTLPTATLDRYYSGRECDATEIQRLRCLPQVSAALLGGIPRIEAVVRIIEGAEHPHRTSGRTELTGHVEREQRASQVLRAASEFDHRLVCGEESFAAISSMRASKTHDSEILDALKSAQAAESHWQTKVLRADHLATGMVFAEDVYLRSGALFARRGEDVRFETISRLTGASAGQGLQEPFRVLVPAAPQDRDGDEDRFG